MSGGDGWFVRMLGGGKTNAGVSVNEHLAMQLPVVYACINRIANPIATFPFRIMRPKRSGGGMEVVTDHPLSSRLALRPNDLMSGRSHRKALVGHVLRWGNGYNEIERNRRGQAVNLWPLLPDRTGPHRNGDSLVYRTSIDGRQFEIDHGDVIHIMDQSFDGYVGISPIAMARQAIGMGLAMEEFGAKFFANDMKSGGFLMHPGRLSGAAKGNVTGKDGERRMNAADPASGIERQGGLDNAHRVKVLEEGMKFVQTTIPPEDAQFLGSREFQIAEIARIYDVPLVLLQSHEKTTSWGSGIEQLMIGFVMQTIAPWISAIESEMNWKLFTEDERAAGTVVKFNMNALLRGDMQSRSEFYAKMFGIGAFSPNRILDLEDEDGIGPDGDEHFVQAGYVPIRHAINPPGIGHNGGPPIGSEGANQ
ncbi:phage portal protein [Jiella pelagia]|uniref:Phage portal protein n=1 Tax=Jiella pelagia TaxID=2986949 RepID=A0ABY7C7J6_9HYPH|nr:phage portal protein [Jiella pelagia]WAP71226.1 phage portal protein [Jiella pelagia]